VAGTVFPPYVVLSLYWGHSHVIHGIPYTRTRSKGCLVEIPHKWHLILVTETVFRLYVDYQTTTQTSILALSMDALLPPQFCLKLVSYESHFTLAAETVFRPYLEYSSIGVTQTSPVVLRTDALQPVQVGLNRPLTNDILL
jgi:hypothetical protein